MEKKVTYKDTIIIRALLEYWEIDEENIESVYKESLGREEKKLINSLMRKNNLELKDLFKI